MTSLRLIWAARDARGLRAVAKTVLLLLAAHADASGAAWPSQPTLAAEAGLSERAVRDAVLELEERGLLTRTAGRHHESTRYVLHLDAIAALAPSRPEGGQGGRTFLPAPTPGRNEDASRAEPGAGKEDISKKIPPAPPPPTPEAAASQPAASPPSGVHRVTSAQARPRVAPERVAVAVAAFERAARAELGPFHFVDRRGAERSIAAVLAPEAGYVPPDVAGDDLAARFESSARRFVRETRSDEWRRFKSYQPQQWERWIVGNARELQKPARAPASTPATVTRLVPRAPEPPPRETIDALMSAIASFR